MKTEELPIVFLNLAGTDGNAYSVLGAWSRAARRAKWPADEIDRVKAEAMDGGYDHLLRTIAANCTEEVGGDE